MIIRILRALLLLLLTMAALYATVVAALAPARLVGGIVLATILIGAFMTVSHLMARELRYQWPAVLAAVLALIGLGAVGSVAVIVSDTMGEGGDVNSICGPAGLFGDCHGVVGSEWSAVRLGSGPEAPRIPYTTLGLLFYSALLAWFLAMGRPRPERRLWQLFPLCLTALGTMLAIYLTVIMFAKLGKACPLCLTSHAVTVLLLVISVLSWPRTKPEAVREERTTARPPGIEAVSGATTSPPGLAGIRSWIRPGLALCLTGIFCATALGFQHWSSVRQQVVPCDVRADDSARGPDSAPFVLIVYSDLLCPHCRAFAKQIREVRHRYPERLRYVFRHFPLNTSCNSHVWATSHLSSCDAAALVEAGRRLGGDEAFWKLHDAIYAYDGELSHKTLVELAGRIGLDTQRLLAEMKNPRVWDRVKAHVESSRPFRVVGTPSAFLNGRRVNRWRSMKFWEEVLGGPSDRDGSASEPAHDPVHTQHDGSHRMTKPVGRLGRLRGQPTSNK